MWAGYAAIELGVTVGIKNCLILQSVIYATNIRMSRDLGRCHKERLDSCNLTVFQARLLNRVIEKAIYKSVFPTLRDIPPMAILGLYFVEVVDGGKGLGERGRVVG